MEGRWRGDGGEMEGRWRCALGEMVRCIRCRVPLDEIYLIVAARRSAHHPEAHLDEARGEPPLEVVLVRPPMLVSEVGDREEPR